MFYSLVKLRYSFAQRSHMDIIVDEVGGGNQWCFKNANSVVQDSNEADKNLFSPLFDQIDLIL